MKFPSSPTMAYTPENCALIVLKTLQISEESTVKCGACPEDHPVLDYIKGLFECCAAWTIIAGENDGRLVMLVDADGSKLERQ